MKYAVGIEGNSMSGYEYALYMKAYMHMANSCLGLCEYPSRPLKKTPTILSVMMVR